MTRYITIPQAIALVVREVSEYYYASSENDRLRFIPDEIGLELALVFSTDTDSKSGARPLVSLVEGEKDADWQGTATSSHRLSLKLRPSARDGRELKISTDEIVRSWRSKL